MNKSNLNRIGAAMLGVLFTLTGALAQTTNKPQPAPARPALAAQPPAAPARNIRFQFDGIPYADVVERFAQMANKPLVTDTNITGTLTFNDPNTYTYGEALDTLNVVLSMKGLMLIESGNYLRLVPFKELPAMPLRIMRGVEQGGDVRPGEVVTVVLEVKNLDTKEVADAVTTMLSNAGSLAPLSRGRGLIITDRLGNISRIRTLLATIDTEVAVDKQMKTYTLLNASGAIVSDLLNRTFGIATAPKRTTFNPNTKTMEVLPADPNDYITAVYDDASRTLVLFGPTERIALAEEMINKFEQKDGPGGDVRIYFPQTIKADELANIIRQAIPGVAAATETGAAAATKARVITDSTLNRLIVAAPIPGQLEQIELLINRVDKNIHGQAGVTNVPLRSQTIQLTKVFRPRAADTTNLASILTQALTRRSSDGRATTTASISHDAGSQSVVVSGSPGDLQIATDIVTQLETGTSQPTPLQTRFIDVGSVAEAKRLAPMVEQLYRDQVGSGSASAVAHAKIFPDTESGRLVVTASENHLEKIESLVKQLRADKALVQSRRLQIITLKNARVETAITSIQSLVTDKLSDRKWADLPKPSLIADGPNNRLLVTGTDDQIKEVQEVVTALDIAPARTKREMTVIPVQAKTAAEVIALTTQLLDQLGETPTDPLLAPKLMADSTGRGVIVLAQAKDLERIRTLVQQIDVAAPASVRQFKGVELFSRTAIEFLPLVQQLYTEQIKGQTDPAGGPATLTTDAKNNRIVVSGTEKEIARVEALVRQLDPVGKLGAKEETRVIRLKTALAAEIATLVEKSLNAQQTQVRVMVDARSNSLVVTGDSAAVESAALVIAQLDTRSDVQPREMRIIELKQGEAAAVATMATTLSTDLIKDQHGPEYVPQTKIIADAAGNRLIVTGPKNELSIVATVVEQLDQAPEASGGARVFKLVNADAAQVVGVISNAMLKFDARNLPIRRVTVSLDRESNSIVVAGQRNDLKEAENIIMRLDGEGVDPTAIGGAATGRARELKIIDVRSEDVDGLAALAMKVFSAQNSGRTVTNLVSVTPEPAGKRLIVLAPAPVLTQIETVIAALDAKPDQGARELHTIEVKNSTATELLPTVTRIYAEQTLGRSGKPATIYPDASGTRFTVFGTKEQAGAVRQIVETLSTQTRSPRETKTFDLGRLTEATRLMPIAQQLYRDQLSNSPQAGAPDAQMVSDGKTGKLIVSARADQMKMIEDIFARLQTGVATNQVARETRSFEVGSAADVLRLQPLVQQLYTEQWKEKSETDPADAQILSDAKTGRLIVTGKPEHLKHIEGILTQLGTGATKPRSDARETRILDLTTASAVELATTVRTLYLEEAKPRFGAQTPDTLITPDTGGNRLIVVGETNELDAIESIVKKLDKVSAQSGTARVFKLKSADPAKVAEILTNSLVRFDAFGRAQKRATVSVDAKTRTLIVTGDPKELTSVATIIEQLDQSLGAQPERRMKVVTLKQGRVGELMGKVRQLYNDQLTAQPELSTTEILMLEEPASNQLILAGSEAQLALAEKILTDLQAAFTARGERQTKFIEAGQVDELNRLQPLVQQLYQDRWKNRDASDPADASLIIDAKNGRFIVTGRTNHLAEIESIVAQLRSTELGAPRDTRIYELSSANAAELSVTVKSLYLDQAKTRPAAQPQETLILPDATANRLIVSGATNELAAVEDIIKKLDKVSSQSGTVRLFKLKSADPAKVMEVLGNALMSYDSFGRPRRRVGITVDAKTRTIVVAGDPKELQALQNASAIIEQLDSALGAQAERKIKVVPLKQAKAVELSAKVRQLYNDQLSSQPDLGTTDILIMEDTPSNQLILAGSEAQLKLLERIIGDLQSVALTQGARETKLFEVGQADEATRLQPLVMQLYTDRWKSKDAGDPPDAQLIADAPNARLVATGRTNHLVEIAAIVDMLKQAGAGAKRDVHVVTLQRNSAQALSSMLTQLYAKQAASADPSERLTVSALADDRTLVVEAATKTFEKVEQLVKTLDASEPDGQSVIQTVHLKKGRADSLAEAINSALTNRLGQALAQRVSVTAVGGVNSLLINGPTNAVEGVMKIVRELDNESEASDIEVRIYKLENGTAKEVSAILEQLLDNVSRYQSRVGTGRSITANISVNERANSLLISGTPAHFRMVDKILPTLDKAPERSERDVQFVWLKKAKAFEVATRLEAVFAGRDEKEKPVIESDTFNNSLTIIARRGDMAEIQNLISRLDEQSKDTSLQVRLRPLDRVTADQMARMLQNIYPQMANGRVRVVEKIEPPKDGQPAAPSPAPGAPVPPNPPQPPAPVPAPAVGDNQAAARTNAAPEVVIAVDKNANALILSGPAQELDNIDHIISELSFNFYNNESEFRVFPLQDADPVIVARTLGDLLKQEPVPVPVQPGQPPQTRTPQPRITVVAEPRTRSVIVRARPTDFTLLESLIKQLDTAGQAALLEFRLVILTNAPPEKILPLVQQLVAQHNVVRPGDPLTVTADARSRGLLVVARSNVIDQVERMIRGLDTPSAFGEAEVLVVNLKKANAGQLALVLQNMLKPGAAGEITTEARELQEQVRRLKVQNDAGQAVTLDLTKPIRIAADPAGGGAGGNRLLLTSTPDNLKALAALAAMMDSVPVVESVVVKLMPLKFADAASVSQTLTTIFTQGRQLGAGPAGPGAQPDGPDGKALVNPLNVAVDARANTVILSGQIETMNLALKLIADMDKPMDRFITEVKLFRLKHASATRMLPLLQSVFTEGPAVPGTEGLSTQVTRLRTVKDATPPKTTESAKSRGALVIQADDASNILIVAARSDTLPLIQDVIDQLDIPAASGLETVRIYPLNHADPAAIQKILNDIYASPRATATMRNEDKPLITVDDRTSALVVAGNSKSFGIIEGLLLQLDQKLPFDLRDIRLVPLENADATVVAATIQKLMDARVTQRATLNKGTADTLKVTILADPRSNSLLVAGGRESFEMVESLARQLDKSGPALSGRIRLIPLANADARVMAATLTTLFDQRYAAQRAADVGRTKPIILADPRSNSLLITANQEDNVAIDDLLKRLDTRTDNPALTLTVLTLKHNDAGRVATTVESIFAARLKAQALPGQTPLPNDHIKLEPDPLNNALIVSASKENLELIQSLVQKIDIEPVIEGGMLQTFTLEFADAQRVATMLRALVQQGLYRPGVGAGAAAALATSKRDALAISVDPRSNTMFVSASPENLALVREIIRRVDTKDFAGSGDLKVYQLKNARATSLANTLEQFFRAKRTADTVAVNAAERSIPVSVIPDDRMNTVLIVGSKDAFDAADRIIQQLDGESVFSRLNFKVFPLKRATATKLQSTLQAIVANRPPRVKGEPVEPITVVADQWANALLVAASVEDMSTVESLLQRLDADAADSGVAVHFFPLAKADARRVALTVQGLFREGTAGTTLPVTVSADERINAIVVSCGEADAKRIGELVKKLDTELVARVSEIKVFPLKYARAESLSTILNTSLNTKPTPLSDQQNPNAQSVLQFITRSEQGQELVTAALKEAILITPDARMNSLIVSGPVDYMGLLEQIIGRLDASSPQQAKIKVFALQNADAHQMATLLMQMFRMTQASAAAGNQRSIQYTLMRTRVAEDGAVLGDDEMASATVGTAEQNALTVTVDPRTNTLLVGGTDHYVLLVSQIIESLDASPANERKTEVVRLKNSQATEVATAIRTFLDQERQRVTQVLGPEAVGTVQRVVEREVAVVAEPISNTLLVSANPRYFEQMKALIEELDKPQPQVLIQVLIAEVTLDEGKDLGLGWTYNGNAFSAGVDISQSKWIASGFASAVSGGDYSFLLRALNENGKLEVLSRPQIVTADNKPANINIGQRVPLITDSRVTERGDTINSFRYEDVGVNLSVTPKISPDGFVKMDIGTTNSAISSSNVEINKSATVPIINQRKANTTVSAQSGQTILIGGLISTFDDKRVKKLAVIGSIPWIGNLFRTTHQTRDRKELLILLTPQILTSRPGLGIAHSLDDMTREQLDRSGIKGNGKHDQLQKQLLDPLFPPAKPAAPVQPPGDDPTDEL